ncbi:unnamed protein product [Pylaiella littoralis]
MAADQVDLTVDSDDEDLQAAIRASLSTSCDGDGASSGGSSWTNGGIGASAGPAGKRPSSTNSSGRERSGNGKRPRSCESAAKPPLYRLLATSPSDRVRTGSVALEDLLGGQFSSALLCNYMVDMGLLGNAQPRLLSVPVVVVHGHQPGSANEVQLRNQCAAMNPGIKLHGPEIPRYGTHHTKMMILKFPLGVRVVVLTANFVSMDFEDKSQAVWYQEFPLRESETCDFEESLVGYLDKVGGPAAEFGSSLRQYDFRAARVALVPSAPGTGKKQHKGEHLHKYGHMRVRALLSQEQKKRAIPNLHKGGHKIVLQFTSLASLSSNPNLWLSELLESFMPHVPQAEGTTGLSRASLPQVKLEEHMRLVWPSVEAVRTSSKGWASGGSICCNAENMYGGRYKWPDMRKYGSNDPTPELKPLLRKWTGNASTNRARDAPHIKTYLRYREVEVVGKDGAETRVDRNEAAWFLLTSSNLSRSAWGYLDEKASTPQLSLKSFEMGVMFLPSLLGRPPPVSDKSGDGGGDAEPLAFTCTPGEAGLTQRFPLSLLYECEPGKALPLELLPLPYVLPAPRYDFSKSQDNSERPWVWDQKLSPLDRTMSSWPGVGR